MEKTSSMPKQKIDLFKSFLVERAEFSHRYEFP